MKKYMNKYSAIGVVGAVVVGAFFGGMQYGKTTVQSAGGVRDTSQTFQEGGSGARRNGGQPGGGFVAGQILNKDATSITLKLQNGGSKIIFFSDATGITKTASGTISDLVQGANVIVSGSVNQDGSVTAQSIQLRPEIPSGNR